MAKYKIEIEIDDATALRFSYDIMTDMTKEIRPDLIARAVQGIVNIYGTFPRVADSRDDAAMTICRAIATERAAQFGAERGQGFGRAVEDVLDAMLRGGR